MAKAKKNDTGATLGFEAKLWLAADKMMNLAIRGIDSDLGAEHADSFRRDLHKDLKADYGLANPPFNDSDRGGDQLREDVRWKYGVPPTGNANFAWVQHSIHHLAPHGMAGFVGFCKSAKTAEITEPGYVLTPGRCVGAEEIEDDGEPFDRLPADGSYLRQEKFCMPDIAQSQTTRRGRPWNPMQLLRVLGRAG